MLIQQLFNSAEVPDMTEAVADLLDYLKSFKELPPSLYCAES